MILAVYGTLKRGFGNNSLLERINAKFITSGKTSNKYTMFKSGIPFVTKKEMTNITVELFDVNDDTVYMVDRLEDNPNWYKREEIPIDGDDGKKYQAWLYFMDHASVKHNQIVETGNY